MRRWEITNGAVTILRMSRTAIATASTSGGAWMFAFAIAVIVAYLMPFERSWNVSLTEHYADAAEDMEGGAAEGVFGRQLAILCLGCLGVAAIVSPSGRRLTVYRPLLIMSGLFLAWAGVSCLWADEPLVSLRRFLALLCEVLAGIGIARRVTPRQFVSVVLACTTTWLGLGILAELAHGTFRPWEEGYRFAGVFHPNDMGFNCACAILSAAYLVRDNQRAKGLLYSILLGAFAILVLTRSRTSLGATVLALGLSWLWMSNPRRVFIGVMTGAWVALLVAVLFGGQLADMATNAIVLGRTDDDMTSLTGRIPLWTDLLEYAAERPWTGYGYNGFWTVERMREVSYSQTWSVGVGHSSYIDLLLSVGIIGVILCFSAILFGLRRAALLELKLPNLGYGFVAMVLGYTLLNSVSETSIGITWLGSLFGITGLCLLTFVEASVPRDLSMAQSRDRSRTAKKPIAKAPAFIPQVHYPRLTTSVIICTYNHAKYIRTAIESVLHQTRVPDEIIVVNDGSTDETAEILREFSWPVRVITQKNQGRSVARNVGLQSATGELIVFLDSDDTLVPDSIERRATMFEADAELGVVYGEMYLMDASGRTVGRHRECMPGIRPSGFIFNELALRCFILMPAMIRRTAIENHRFDESLSTAEDYDLWRRIAAKHRFQYLEEPIACYRMHDSNTVTSQPTKMLEAELEVQRRILAMPEFQKLNRRDRGRVYCCHGVKCAVLGKYEAARMHLLHAVIARPFALGNLAISLLGLISPRLLARVVLERRQRNRKQLGDFVGSSPVPDPDANRTLQNT